MTIILRGKKYTFDCSKCRNNCHSQCCGPVPISKEVFEKNKHLLNKEALIHDGGTVVIACDSNLVCGFLGKDGKCLIYEDRPEVCRVFGTKKLPCAFMSPVGKPRKQAETKKMLHETDKKISNFLAYQKLQEFK